MSKAEKEDYELSNLIFATCARIEWQEEAWYFSKLTAAEPDFLRNRRYFFPAQTIEDTKAYYATEPTKPLTQGINLLRHLIRQQGAIAAESPEQVLPFFQNHPLPKNAFQVEPAVVAQLQTMQQASVQVYLLGRVNREFFAKQSPARMHPEQFLTEQEQLYQAFCQKHPHLASLQRLNPLFLDILETHYFQGKPLTTISEESGLKADRAYVYKDLGLKSLGIKQELKGHAARSWKHWLEPILVRWQVNDVYISSLPPAWQEAARDLLRGKNARVVSNSHQIKFKTLQALRHCLLYGVTETEPFKQERLHQQVEKLLMIPFNLQAITHLTLAVLEAKAKGKTFKDIEKSLNVDSRQIKYLLSGALEDITLTAVGKILKLHKKVWQQALDLYKIFVEERTAAGDTLTPRQKRFIEGQLQKGGITFAESRYLYPYLGIAQPRKERRLGRIELAQTVLKENPGAFTYDQRTVLWYLAWGATFNEINQAGIKDSAIYRVLSKAARIEKNS